MNLFEQNSNSPSQNLMLSKLRLHKNPQNRSFSCFSSASIKKNRFQVINFPYNS